MLSKKLIYLAPLFLLFFACDNKNVMTVKNEEGEVTEKYSYNEKKQKHGLYEAFINGVKVEEAHYQNGTLNGKRVLFHTNGAVEIEENYENDKIVGSYKVYYHTGVLSQEANYIDGMMQGTLKTYYKSGKIKEEVTMKDNQEQGPFTEYHENGQVKWKGQFLNGDNEFGLIQEFDETGVLIKKMMCDSMARCSTIWTKEKGDINP